MIKVRPSRMRLKCFIVRYICDKFTSGLCQLQFLRENDRSCTALLTICCNSALTATVEKYLHKTRTALSLLLMCTRRGTLEKVFLSVRGILSAPGVKENLYDLLLRLQTSGTIGHESATVV